MDMIGKIRLGWTSALIALVIILAMLAIAPWGSLSQRSDFLSADYFIGPLAPQERLAGNAGDAARTLIGEPVYFSLWSARPFQQAEVTVEYEGEAPLIELGLRQSGTAWNFQRRPLWHAGLEELARDDRTLAADGILLWQRQKTYASISDFLKHPPRREEVAAYDYALPAPFRLADYRPGSAERTIDAYLRGGYTIQTYSGGEPIGLSFALRDLNRNKDADSVRATLYDENGKAIAVATLADDGGAEKTESSLREVRLTSGPLAAGPYRLEFSASDDIITEGITTRQPKLSFMNQVWLAGHGRRNLALVSDAVRLTAQTSAPASRQDIRFDGQVLALRETYRQASAATGDLSRRAKPIVLAVDDVTLSADGAFAFSAAELIDPSIRSFTGASAQAAPGFVIARYEPQAVGRGKAVFRLAGAYREKGKYSFMIAAPGVSSEHPLVIRSVSIRLSGPTLWEYLSKKTGL